MVDTDSRSQSSAYLTAADGTRSNGVGQVLPSPALSLEAMMLEAPKLSRCPNRRLHLPSPAGRAPWHNGVSSGSVSFGCIALNIHRDFQATYSASKRNQEYSTLDVLGSSPHLKPLEGFYPPWCAIIADGLQCWQPAKMGHSAVTLINTNGIFATEPSGCTQYRRKMILPLHSHHLTLH